MEGDIRDYILEWLRRGFEPGVPRELNVPARLDRVVSVVGPRRAGKTHYFLQLCQRNRPRSLHLNFEDTRLMGVDFKRLRDMVRIFIEVSGREPSSIFFDEAQNLPGWERALRTLLDLRKYHLYVTGSSSKLLSKEIATQLRGRTFSYILLPFSFREFLKARNIVVDQSISLDEAAVLRNRLHEYLKYGGFPEVVFESSERERILREYAEVILYKDIVERHGLKNIGLARFLLSFFLQNFSREFSVNKIYRSMQQVRVGKDSVYSYVDKLQDSLAVFFLRRFSKSVYVRESWPRKAYICDTGLALVMRFSPDLGRLMENVVFLELLRRTNANPLLELFYWRDAGGGEVDFVVKNGMRVEELIQVTFAEGRGDIEKRELKSLLSASEKLGCTNLTMVTWNYEDVLDIGGLRVRCIPLWRWLLSA